MGVITVDTLENLVEIVSVEIAIGPVGPRGPQGVTVNLQVANGYIQYQHVGDTSWINLIAISALIGPAGPTGATGADGKQVLLQVANGYIQWKYQGDASWNNLIAISTLVGPQGPQGIQGIPGPSGGVGAGVLFYPTNIQSDLWATTGYYLFEQSPEVVPTAIDIPTVCNNNKVNVMNFISDSEIDFSAGIVSGPWITNLWGYVSDTAGASQSVADFYIRTSAGVETLLFSITSPNIAVDTKADLYSSNPYIANALSFNTGDRLVVKLSVQTQNTTNTTIHLVSGGASTYSYITSPFVTDHNNLPGLYGQSPYNHLSNAQLAKLNAIPAGSDTWVQFNSGGVLSASAGFEFDPVNLVVKIGQGVMPLINSPIAIQNIVNGWLQHNIQNTSNGNLASSDMVATADNGSDTLHYIDVGINSSQYSDPTNYPLEGANDAYIQTPTDNIFIIAGGSGKSVTIQAGGTAAGNISATFNQSGVVIPGTLSVNGNSQSGVNTGDETKQSIETKLGINDTEVIAIQNLSGVNSGDETKNSINTKIGYVPASKPYTVAMSYYTGMGGF